MRFSTRNGAVHRQFTDTRLPAASAVQRVGEVALNVPDPSGTTRTSRTASGSVISARNGAACLASAGRACR